MGKERVMKHAAPLTDIQKQMFAFIEEYLNDKDELLSNEEVMEFWSGFHQELKLCEEETVSQKDEKQEVVTFLYEEPEEIMQVLEQEMNQALILDEVEVDPIDGIKEFLSIHIHVLFFAVMSLNILWMEMLNRNYGNNSIIQLMEYLMIIIVIGFLFSWIKPNIKVFWKTSAHD